LLRHAEAPQWRWKMATTRRPVWRTMRSGS
jgi:hypothetical protein